MITCNIIGTPCPLLSRVGKTLWIPRISTEPWKSTNRVWWNYDYESPSGGLRNSKSI